VSDDLEGQMFLPGCAPRGKKDREYRPQQPVSIKANAESAAERRRVAGEVSREVLAFCRGRLALGLDEWRMSDLTEYVRERVMCAPDSAGRILRQLAQQGALEYQLVSRAESRYRIVTVREGVEC
jgi:hypothetical protein